MSGSYATGLMRRPSLGLDGDRGGGAGHDAKIDDPALIAALASNAFYVGALGSRRTTQAG